MLIVQLCAVLKRILGVGVLLDSDDQRMSKYQSLTTPTVIFRTARTLKIFIYKHLALFMFYFSLSSLVGKGEKMLIILI